MVYAHHAIVQGANKWNNSLISCAKELQVVVLEHCVKTLEKSCVIQYLGSKLFESICLQCFLLR